MAEILAIVKTGILLLVYIMLMAVMVEAKRSYLTRVPNYPEDWPAIGHTHPNDGDDKVQFGRDFSKQGKKWTVDLCQMDSDGDGRTNGEELGDYNCLWTPGQPRTVVPYKITNPGKFDVFELEDIALFHQTTGHQASRPPTPSNEPPPAAPSATPVNPLTNSPDVPGATTSPTTSENNGQEEHPQWKPLKPWLIAHVVLGVLSLGLLMPLATIFTSIFRRQLGGNWKDGHVYTSILAAVMLLVCLILPLSFAHDIEFELTHVTSGLILFSFVALQSLSGSTTFFCCQRQNLVVTVHKRIAQIVVFPLIAIVLTTGYDLLSSKVAYDAVNAVKVFGACHVIAVLILWCGHELFAFNRRRRLSAVKGKSIGDYVTLLPLQVRSMFSGTDPQSDDQQMNDDCSCASSSSMNASVPVEKTPLKEANNRNDDEAEEDAEQGRSHPSKRVKSPLTSAQVGDGYASIATDDAPSIPVELLRVGQTSSAAALSQI